MSRPQGIELTTEHFTIIRDALGKRTIRSLADAVGCGESQLYALFNGARRPSRRLLDNLCSHLDLEWEIKTVIRRKGSRKATSKSKPAKIADEPKAAAINAPATSPRTAPRRRKAT